MVRALQVLGLGEEKHELIDRKVDIVAVVVLVEQHGNAVDDDRFGSPHIHFRICIAGYPNVVVDPVVHVEREVVHLV